jgi:hypothetical protein
LRSRRRGATASREVGYPAECCLCRCTWAVGLPRSLTNASSFPTDRGGLPPSPSPCILRSRVHPLVSFVLLQSSFVQSSARPRHPCGCNAPCSSRGVSSLFATSALGVHCPPGIPCPSAFRPQRFARSRRFAPPCALRIYFAALPCPGFSLQGFPPPAWPHHLVGGRYPRAVGAAACRLPGASERHVDLRVLIQTGVRSVRRVF